MQNFSSERKLCEYSEKLLIVCDDPVNTCKRMYDLIKSRTMEEKVASIFWTTIAELCTKINDPVAELTDIVSNVE